MRGNKPLSAPSSLGEDLATARQEQDLTLQQVEQRIKIRTHYLEALEADDYAALPSTVQGRGFLRNYARFLGIDPDDAETRFNMGLIAQSRNQRRRRSAEPLPAPRNTPARTGAPYASDVTPPPRRSSDTTANMAAARLPTPTALLPVTVPTSRRGGLSDPAAERAEQRRRETRTMTLRAVGTLLVAAFILIALLTYALHPNLLPVPLAAIFDGQATPSATELPTATAVDLATSTPTVPVVAAGAAGTSIGAEGNSAAGGANAAILTIQITVHDRSPLMIKIDSDVRYSGVPQPNTVITYTVQGTQQLFLHTGNAGSLDVVLNGVTQPKLGLDHQIIDKVYSLASLQATPVSGSPGATPIGSPTSGVLTFTPGAASTTAPTADTSFPTAALKP